MIEFLMNKAECTLRGVKQWQCECSRGEKVDSNAGNTSKADMSAYFLSPPPPSAAAQCSATYFLHCFDIPPNGTPSQRRRFFVVRKLVSVTHIKDHFSRV